MAYTDVDLANRVVLLVLPLPVIALCIDKHNDATPPTLTMTLTADCS